MSPGLAVEMPLLYQVRGHQVGMGAGGDSCGKLLLGSRGCPLAGRWACHPCGVSSAGGTRFAEGGGKGQGDPLQGQLGGSLQGQPEGILGPHCLAGCCMQRIAWQRHVG